MKIDLIKTIIAIGVSILIAYGFYSFHHSVNSQLLVASSFVELSLSGFFVLGLRFEKPRTTANIRLVSSIFFFYEDLTFLGFILFSLSLWDILSYKKSEERFIQKFGTKEFFELKEKKEKAVQSFKRLEQISRAKEELQTLTFNEK